MSEFKATMDSLTEIQENRSQGKRLKQKSTIIK